MINSIYIFGYVSVMILYSLGVTYYVCWETHENIRLQIIELLKGILTDIIRRRYEVGWILEL
jgi:hypothetical protein